MFTGLIEATGRVERVTPTDRGRALRIVTELGRELSLGESVAVNGVCLTVIERDDEHFAVDVSPETLRVTTVGEWVAGRVVNLERSLRAGDRFGGHFVQGHVDAIGRIRAWRDEGEFRRLELELPDQVTPHVISRGSIAVDGISLTVAELGTRDIAIQIVPFTLAHTSLRMAREGDAVNLEADMIGKYVARQIELRGLTAPA
jgi:riboflavin synthase